MLFNFFFACSVYPSAMRASCRLRICIHVEKVHGLHGWGLSSFKLLTLAKAEAKVLSCAAVLKRSNSLPTWPAMGHCSSCGCQADCCDRRSTNNGSPSRANQ